MDKELIKCYQRMSLKSQAGKKVISFANRLDSDQTGQHVGSDLDPKCLSMHEKKNYQNS